MFLFNINRLLVIFLSILLSLFCVVSHANSVYELVRTARTARTVEKDKWGIDFTLDLHRGWEFNFNKKFREYQSQSNISTGTFLFGPFSPRFLISRGLSDNLDLTLKTSVPVGRLSLSLKHAFFNDPDSSFSMAGIAAAGLSNSIYRYYLGLIFNYGSDWFTAYINAGYTMAFIANKDYDSPDATHSEWGINFWLTQSLAIDLNASFTFLATGIDGEIVPFSARFMLVGPKLRITYRF